MGGWPCRLKPGIVMLRLGQPANEYLPAASPALDLPPLSAWARSKAEGNQMCLGGEAGK